MNFLTPCSRGLAKISPRARLLAVLFISVAVAGVSSLWAGAFAMVSCFGLLLAAHVPWSQFRRRFLAVNAFLLFMWLLVPFTFSDMPLGSFSQAGAHLCLLVTLKANAILMCFTAFLHCLSPFALGQALASLHLPAKLVWLFLLLERNIFLLRRQWLTITDAARLRGFTMRFSLHAYKNFAALLALWLFRSWHSAQILQDAMLLRGWDGTGVTMSQAQSCSPAGPLFSVLGIFLSILIYINYSLP